MNARRSRGRSRLAPSQLLLRTTVALAACNLLPAAQPAHAQPAALPAPAPLIDATHAADWVFAYKFNSSTFDTHGQVIQCIFGGTPASGPAGQAYAEASSAFGALVSGPGLIGTSPNDPVGATFSEIYNGELNFVVWNDQFYGDPKIACGKCSKWGHSKGVLGWDSAGNGLMLQVTTPDWPGAGSAATPRRHEGNTLGCEHATHNVQYGQHFFALKLTPDDTAAVLDALVNAAVVTDVGNPQLARLGGPAALVAKARQLGRRNHSVDFQDVVLSSGVRLISKAPDLWVPPWQLISARLDVPLRTSTWRANSPIPTTTDRTAVSCWRPSLGKPRAVEIAITGKWMNKVIRISGSGSHGKLGVSLDPAHPFTVFGDMNQQGSLAGTCGSAQNGRGGLFFVLGDRQLYASMRQLLEGETAPSTIPRKTNKKTPTHPRTH